MGAELREWFGRFRTLEELKRGGMGVTFLAEDSAGGLVVIKQPLTDVGFDAKRWRRETETLLTLNGLYTVRAIAVSEVETDPWVAMDYIEMPTVLDAVTKRKNGLPIGDVLSLARLLVTGLEDIHNGNLVHRDIKPDNVMWRGDSLKIIDYGIVRSTLADGQTVQGFSPGTPGYKSPEQYSGEPVGFATDIFAAGCVLVYAATGRKAYATSTPSSLSVYSHEEGQRLTGAISSATALVGSVTVSRLGISSAEDAARSIAGAPDLTGVPPELLPLVAAMLTADPRARPTPSMVRDYVSVLKPRDGYGSRAHDGELYDSETIDSPPPGSSFALAAGLGIVVTASLVGPSQARWSAGPVGRAERRGGLIDLADGVIAVDALFRGGSQFLLAFLTAQGGVALYSEVDERDWSLHKRLVSFTPVLRPGSVPTLVRLAQGSSGALTVVVSTSSGDSLSSVSDKDAGWSDWSLHSGEDSTADSRLDPLPHLELEHFALHAGGRMRHRFYLPNLGWSRWREMQGALAGHPAQSTLVGVAISRAVTGKRCLLLWSEDGAGFVRWFDPSGEIHWSPWQAVSIKGGVRAVEGVSGEDQVSFVALGTSGEIKMWIPPSVQTAPGGETKGD